MFQFLENINILNHKIMFSIMGKFLYKKFFNNIDIKENSKILDFGCGVKNYSSHLINDYLSINITSVVISRDKTHFLKTNKNNKQNEYINLIEFLNRDEKEEYDLIFSFFSLKNISTDNLKSITINLIEKLKDGGVLIIRETLEDVDIYKRIKEFLVFNKLSLMENHILEIPYIGNVIEIKYKKNMEI